MVRNPEIIGEAAKRVPEEVRASYPDIDWRRIAGLRDVIAHGYFALEPAMLWNVAAVKVPHLLEQVRAVVTDLEAGTDNPPT